MLQLSSFKGSVGRGALTAVLLAGAMALFLFLYGSGEGQEVERIDYPENGTGIVTSYTAIDPEGNLVTWSVSDPDAADFEITGGVLTFKTPPDYENPSDRVGVDDQGAEDNIYLVVVTATATGGSDIQSVKVTVTNVDEPGVVGGLPTTPKEGTEISTITLTDPDGKPSAITDTDLTNETGTTWQWARGRSASGPWTDIEDADDATTGKSKTYTPVEDDVDMYLRVTATYDDGHCTSCVTKKVALAISTNRVVKKDYINTAPEFPDQTPDTSEDNSMTTTREVQENSADGTNVGDPVTAVDIGEDGRQEILTYSLQAVTDDMGIVAATKDDPDSFDIHPNTGQISVAEEVMLDIETKDTYTVVVKALDSSTLSDMITVTINLIDVDEPPTIAAPTNSTGATAKDHLEIPASTDVSTYSATDPESSSITWSLSGADNNRFEISSGGVLTFESVPDFEAPEDSGRNNVYNVTVVATDDAGNTDSREVTVKVTNIEEDGTVTLSNLQPEVGTGITASLSDPDGGVTSLTWQWSNSDAANGTFADITGATSATYTPASADVIKFLKATASYFDRKDNNTEAFAEESANPVQADEAEGTSNQRPDFADSRTERQLTEHVEGDSRSSGENIGVAVGATDPDMDILTYSLDSGSATYFDIDRATGQIKTRVRLDREARSSYSVTVTATDPDLARDTISVTITVTDVDERPTFTAGSTAITLEENRQIASSDGAYRATDPERQAIVWTLTGADADDFSISSGGVLTFDDQPDFEGPSDRDEDSGTDGDQDAEDNIYRVTVKASDGGAGTTAERVVVITVTNVDEEGAVTLNSLQPQEDANIEAQLTDPDNVTTGSVTWQWAKASSRRGTYANIVDAQEAMYTPKADDVGTYLRATISYTDGHGKNKAARMESENAVRAKPYLNKAPEFEGISTTRTIAENPNSGARVGDPVTATDIGENGSQEGLTYTLAGTDAASFAIDGQTGQISVLDGKKLDFEGTAEAADNCTVKNACVVKATATDGSGLTHAITVNIKVINVDEAPDVSISSATNALVAITGNLTDGYEHEEPHGTNTLQITFVGNDPETTSDNNTTDLTWTLAGADAGDFTISSDGALTFREPPDYENPADSGRNNVYNVTVQATDDGQNTTSVKVSVTVTNVDEDGAVTLSHVQPEDGIGFTAVVTDPDGGVTGVTWQWERSEVIATDESCTDATSNISDADSATYTPVFEDVGKCFLQAVVTYTDRLGSGKSAKGISMHPAQASDTSNQPPKFRNPMNDSDGTVITTTERSVDEKMFSPPVVGDPVTAIDGDPHDPGDYLDYSLSGTDARYFTIDRATGQISVGEGTKLDFESRQTYTVTVTATDPSYTGTSSRTNTQASITVYIRVTDFNEPPVLSKKALVIRGDRSIGYTENDGDSVAEYTASSPTGASVSWRLSGTDASDFLISNGLLTFRSPPNFEVPADSNRDNSYTVTVIASSGSIQDSIAVTVDVANVDEDGTVSLSPSRGIVGVVLTASLTDPDGDTRNVSWQWASSNDGATGWANISGANSNSYTPDVDDAGTYLRATANYTDEEGPGKSAGGITAGEVRADDDGVVTLSPAQPAVGDTVTASVSDPDGGVIRVTWQWAISPNGTTGWTDILGATSETHRPVQTNLGSYLRATASYDDADGPGKIAEAVTSAAVGADDDGSVTLSPSQLQVGDTVTASLSDPDGGVTGLTWQWAISPNGSTNWSIILGTTSATYTATEANVGSYLRAAASYDDAAGDGKSAEAVTSAAVGADDDGSVILSPSQPQVGDTVAASLSDPDAGVTGLTWQWAISPNGSTNWSIILGATSAIYTATEANVGNFLRATANYDDAVGDGKSAEAITISPVAELDLVSTYDANGNGNIEREEVFEAVRDYFSDEITKDEVIMILTLYFAS